MAHIAYAPTFGQQMTLLGPHGYIAVFNNSADSNYVGMLRSASGLDGPEVREYAEDSVNMDGGVHGPFFYGRRSIVLEGMVENPLDSADRTARLNRLMRASNALRTDAFLAWTVPGGTAVQVACRRNNRLNISGGWNKEFQLPLVAADPRIYGATLNSQAVLPNATAVCENSGTTTSYPVLTITGPITNPVLTNQTTSESLSLTITLTTGQTVVVDTLKRTILQATTNKFSTLNFSTASWWGLQPGNNTIFLGRSTSSGAAGLSVQRRHAWV
jgi:hypothetical protein